MEIKNKINPVHPAMILCFLRRFFSQKLNGIKNATNTETIPIVQPNGVQKENGSVIQFSTTAPTQKIDPNKINGKICNMESLIVTIQTLWLILFIFGWKLVSNQLISFCINTFPLSLILITYYLFISSIKCSIAFSPFKVE